MAFYRTGDYRFNYDPVILRDAIGSSLPRKNPISRVRRKFPVLLR